MKSDICFQINNVVIRGINDEELTDFVSLTEFRVSFSFIYLQCEPTRFIDKEQMLFRVLGKLAVQAFFSIKTSVSDRENVFVVSEPNIIPHW